MNGALGQELQVLRIAVLVAGGIGLFCLVYGISSAPTRVATRLGLRGLKRQRVLQSNEMWAAVEPMVRWLGVRVSGIPSDDQRAALDRQIGLAGDYLGLTADEYLAMSLLSFAGGLIGGAIFGVLTGLGSMMIIILGMLGGALPYMQISGTAQERIKSIGRGLPYVIDLRALMRGRFSGQP